MINIFVDQILALLGDNNLTPKLPLESLEQLNAKIEDEFQLGGALAEARPEDNVRILCLRQMLQVAVKIIEGVIELHQANNLEENRQAAVAPEAFFDTLLKRVRE